jgi:hypothetical protein
LTATWSNQPTATDVDLAAAPSGDGVTTFNVTAQVASMYVGTNNGFLIRAAVEDFVGINYYSAREGSVPPTLTITYG